jgi:hypothetical protein
MSSQADVAVVELGGENVSDVYSTPRETEYPKRLPVYTGAFFDSKVTNWCWSTQPVKLQDYDKKKTISELPPNIYSAIIVSSSVEFSDDWWVNRALEAEIFLCAMANVCIQFIGIYFAYKLYSNALAENDNHSCGHFQTNRNLRWMSVGLWAFTVLIEFYETYSMQLWISYAFGDSAAGWFSSCLQKVDPFFMYFCCGFRPSYWLIPPRMREAFLVKADGEYVTDTEGNMAEIFKSLRGASIAQQIFIKVIVLAVKYFVAIVLLLVGTGWLVSTTEDEDLLLNCIALEFILQLSTNIYDFFLSAELKRFVEEDAPKFAIEYEEGPTNFHRATGILKKAVILGVFWFGSNQLFCRDSANFRLNIFD